MENLYLKEVKENDIDILNLYNNELITAESRRWVREDELSDTIQKWKAAESDETKIHVYPYWLMKDDEVIGLVIIKNNIEVDEEFKRFGGNISYVILPKNRKQGYGTKALNLALEKCFEIGIETAMISCTVNNIGSRKIIENNYGIFKEELFSETHNNNLRIYHIDVQESLRLFKENNLNKTL